VLARRRPRPEGLSEHWRTPAAQAAADAALQTAARANAARAAAEAAARDTESTLPPRSAKRGLARLPRRAIWSAVAGVVGASIVFYMLALRLLDENDRTAMAAKPGARAKAGSAAAIKAPAVEPASAAIGKALAGLPVTVGESAAGTTIALNEDRQFARAGNRAQSARCCRKSPGRWTSCPGDRRVGHADHAAARATPQQASSAARARVLQAPGAKLRSEAACGEGRATPAAGAE
jgi:hypothetical protein